MSRPLPRRVLQVFVVTFNDPFVIYHYRLVSLSESCRGRVKGERPSFALAWLQGVLADYHRAMADIVLDAIHNQFAVRIITKGHSITTSRDSFGVDENGCVGDRHMKTGELLQQIV